MSKINSAQTSFRLGEVSPRTFGNTDNDQYLEMAKEITNGYPLPQGGVQRRPGSQLQLYATKNFVLESSSATLHACTDFKTNSTYKYREYAYTTSDGKKWIIVMNNHLLSTWCVYDVTNSFLYPLPERGSINKLQPAAGYVNGLISSTNNIDFSAIDLEEIQFEKAGDTVFMTHELVPPLTIRYLKTAHYDLTAASNFFIPVVARYELAYRDLNSFANEVEFHQAIPMQEANQLDNFGRGSISYPAVAYIPSNAVTLTASLPIFDSSWIGSYIRFNDITGTKTSLVFIYAITNATTASSFFIQGTASGGIAYGTAANTSWEESAWSPRNKYPSTVFAYGSRVGYGGSSTNPNRVWMSAVGDVDELCEIPYLQDPAYSTYASDESRAYSFDIQGCDHLRWSSVGKKIFMGAKNKEFVVFSDTGILGPSTTVVEAATSSGSAYRSAVRSGSEILFVQRSGQRMRGIIFSFQEDDYKSQDISKLAEHIARKSEDTIAQSAAQVPSFNSAVIATSPDTRIWVTDNNGGMSSCTFDREAGVIGWGTHYLGGVGISGGDDKPFICSVVPLASYDNTADELYMLVKRKVNNVDTVRLEKIGGYFNEPTYTNTTFSPSAGYVDWLRTRAIFMDCCLGSYNAVATATATFAELLNEEVDVIADGQYLGKYTLSGSGVLTLENEYHEILVGYHYDTVIETMNLEIKGAQMSNQTKPKSIQEVWCRFHRTSNATVKRSGQSDAQRLQFVQDSNPSDAAVNLFTGDKRAHVGNVDRDMSVIIKQDKPLPFELLAIIFKGMIYD